MHLSRYKRRRFSASRRFTNREEPLLLFKQAVLEYLGHADNLRVMVFYGKGGVGKSRLIGELEASAVIQANHDRLKLFRIDLDIPAARDAVSMLIYLRRLMPPSCALFDYALIKYWNAVRPEQLNMDFMSFLKDSIIVRSIEGIASVTGLGVPLSVTTEWINKINSYLNKRSYTKEEFQEIDRISNSSKELFDRLPYYLGLEVGRLLDSGEQNYIFLFDGYEKHYSDNNLSESEWLRELIAAADAGLFVITCRERIRWEKLNSQWSTILDQHLLEELSQKDSLDFLKSVPVEEEDVIEAIISSSKGLPIYLDVFSDIYEFKKQTGERISAKDFLLSEAQIIESFLSHLPKNEQNALRILTISRLFNQELFEHLAKSLNIDFPVTNFSQLIESTLIEEFEGVSGLYKIHDVVFEQAIKATDKDVAERIVTTSLEFIALRGAFLLGVADLFALFVSHARTAAIHGIESKKIREHLLDIGHILYEYGIWIDIYNTLGKIYVTSDDLRYAFEYLRGLCLRKFRIIGDSL